MALTWMSRLWQQLSRPLFWVGPSPAFPPAPLPGEGVGDRDGPAVTFFGGNLLSQVQAQALFLGNEFSSATTSTERATLDAFLKDITGGPYMQALARAGYNVGPGSAVAGAVDNTSLTVGS